jgi:hypothetical protein
MRLTGFGVWFKDARFHLRSFSLDGSETRKPGKASKPKDEDGNVFHSTHRLTP